MGNPTWKERELEIMKLVPGLCDALLVEVRHKPVYVRVYYCEGVMAIVEYIRDHTKGMEHGAQHHVFKILGKHAEFGEQGRLEVSSGAERMDIYIEDTMVSIEVKTLTMATIETIRGTAMAAFEGNPADKTCIFFLYKFAGNPSPRPPCAYLLTWVAIDSLDIHFDRVASLVVSMVQKAKDQAAKKLGVPAKILIPVENIIKVDDLERELKEKIAINDEQAKTIDEQAKINDEQAKTIDEQAKIIDEQAKINDDQAKTIDDQAKEIARLRKRL